MRAAYTRFIGTVTMSNDWNIRTSDGCVYAQIRKGLGMHLVIYTNCDTVPFLLLVQYKGGLSEIEFTVTLFSNAGMIFLSFSQMFVHFFLYKGRNCPFLLGDIVKLRNEVCCRDVFIIIERYVKLYIFDRVEIVHVGAMAI